MQRVFYLGTWKYNNQFPQSYRNIFNYWYYLMFPMAGPPKINRSILKHGVWNKWLNEINATIRKKPRNGDYICWFLLYHSYLPVETYSPCKVIRGFGSEHVHPKTHHHYSVIWDVIYQFPTHLCDELGQWLRYPNPKWRTASWKEMACGPICNRFDYRVSCCYSILFELSHWELSLSMFIHRPVD